eukprot:NODE_5116_length_426_cov_42.822281_g4447_i0.p1 GENE.NODE_5116_length_426_cov_42.822281_g4447_i0~~NODE_5116_length_426_cov_42.822281_g4447_i0.p1  ORF type:complete len:141 (-),score=34.37 NODE_5116_length_426_cov_42.822281_g4447_i0:3-380(-)
MGLFSGYSISIDSTLDLPLKLRHKLQSTVVSNGGDLCHTCGRHTHFLIHALPTLDRFSIKLSHARKHIVPVVSAEFLEACVHHQRVVDHTPFLIHLPPLEEITIPALSVLSVPDPLLTFRPSTLR